MFWFVSACLFPAFVISWAATWGMRWLSPRIGLIDQPAARKVHVKPTPLGGGIGIYLGYVLPIALAQLAAWWHVSGFPPLPGLPEELQVHLPGVLYRSALLWKIIAAGTVLMVVGLIDDRYGLGWKWRLGIQFLLAIWLVFGVGVMATIFVDQSWVGAVLTVMWIVVLINSLNFLDNMDGLCGGLAVVASAMFAWIMLGLTGEPRWLVGGSLLILCGSACGFLVHNWSPAKIFMGDAGSTFIGMMLATMTILGTFHDDQVTQRHVLLAPIFILAIPLYDFCSVIMIRLKNGLSPFHPDRNHFSHRLTDLGLSRRNAVLTVLLATLTTGLGAVLLYHVTSLNAALLIVLLVFCQMAIVAILEQAGRKKSKQQGALEKK